MSDLDGNPEEQFSLVAAHISSVITNECRKQDQIIGVLVLIFEPPHGKTNNLHMRKQRRRSAER